jgi:hypothetical protein
MPTPLLTVSVDKNQAKTANPRSEEIDSSTYTWQTRVIFPRLNEQEIKSSTYGARLRGHSMRSGSNFPPDIPHLI